VPPEALRWALALSFFAVAAWMLVPDRAGDAPQAPAGRWGVFGLTVLAFFLAEMGDKTQLATVMLAAKYQALWAVTAGTTLGMMLANVPAVLLGDKLLARLPARWLHRTAAAVFVVLGCLVLLSAAG
jgi:Ca2+/H+ antiporter, TMEM165/GDT1 family